MIVPLVHGLGQKHFEIATKDKFQLDLINNERDIGD